jgi:hypothetical protein
MINDECYPELVEGFFYETGFCFSWHRLLLRHSLQGSELFEQSENLRNNKYK